MVDRHGSTRRASTSPLRPAGDRRAVRRPDRPRGRRGRPPPRPGAATDREEAEEEDAAPPPSTWRPPATECAPCREPSIRFEPQPIRGRRPRPATRRLTSDEESGDAWASPRATHPLSPRRPRHRRPRPDRGRPARRPAAPEEPRVEITMGDQSPSQLVLRFTSMGRLARAERLVSASSRLIVEPLIDRAISRDADPDVSGTLYELLVPHLLKGELNDGENLHLLVDGTTATYPWELLAGRGRRRPARRCRWRCVSACSDSSGSREDLRHDIRRASGDAVLVVGNPPPGARRRTPAYGAAAEAQVVGALFREQDRGDWAVERTVWDGTASGCVGRPRGRRTSPASRCCTACSTATGASCTSPRHGEITADPATTRRGRRRPAPPDRQGLLHASRSCPTWCSSTPATSGRSPPGT